MAAQPGPTPSQTIGPFFHDGLVDGDYSRLVSPDHPSAIRVEGTVYDGLGEPVPDAMVEIWQANPAGRYDDPKDDREAFSGFGRSDTVGGGRFSFVTVKPGPVPGPDPEGPEQAPHLMVSVFARGLLKRLVTRVYFPDQEAANAADPVLLSIDAPSLRETLIAEDGRDGVYRFDVRLQGEDQTAFFAFAD